MTALEALRLRLYRLDVLTDQHDDERDPHDNRLDEPLLDRDY